MKKLLVGLVALAIFVGVGLLVSGNLRASAFRLAETERDACYAQQGYFLGTDQVIPDEVRNRCTRPLADYQDGETMRYVYGGLAGLAAAAIFLLLAWLFLLRARPERRPRA